MTHRIKNKVLLYEGVDLLIRNEEELENLFNEFWISITTEFDTFPETKLSI
jgi:hypothetical protein